MYGISRAMISQCFCAVFARIRCLRESLQYLLVIFKGKMAVSANLRDSPQNFHTNCAETYQSPGSRSSIYCKCILFYASYEEAAMARPTVARGRAEACNEPASACESTCKHRITYVSLSLYISLSIYIYIYVCECIYIYIYYTYTYRYVVLYV